VAARGSSGGLDLVGGSAALHASGQGCRLDTAAVVAATCMMVASQAVKQ